ncbi:MAG: TIGR01458 family HAD-type hydrolase [Verrucomicrobia bacterium]|nr:TIGR01458 family HAD-type hydrolase [Verrucomicrobiota bacterium]MCH8512483.1 TIGR01458 family HAD-type hydrolase [Kiritimatiellia bacterium]
MPYDVKALFLDLSGVVYEGGDLIAGAVEVIRQARERGLVLRFVTNTATKSHGQILEKLRGMGIPLEDDELFTAPMAALAYVRKKGWNAHCLVHENLRADFEAVTGDSPDCVVLGDAREALNYPNLNLVFQLCKAGAPLIAIGYNKYFRDDEGLKLDAGAFVRAVEWAADVEAVVMGKPGRAFFDEVVASTGFAASDCLMVGDDAAADVAAAVEAGLRGCLVRTGKYGPGDEDKIPAEASVVDSVADLI